MLSHSPNDQGGVRVGPSAGVLAEDFGGGPVDDEVFPVFGQPH